MWKWKARIIYLFLLMPFAKIVLSFILYVKDSNGLFYFFLSLHYRWHFRIRIFLHQVLACCVFLYLFSFNYSRTQYVVLSIFIIREYPITKILFPPLPVIKLARRRLAKKFDNILIRGWSAQAQLRHASAKNDEKYHTRSIFTYSHSFAKPKTII